MKKILMVLSLSVLMVACEEGGGGSAVPVARIIPVLDPTSPNVTLPLDPGQTRNTSVTVYSLSKTEAPVNGWSAKTYTATGYCFTYMTKTYCADDGIKTIDFTVNNFRYGPYTYTFWGVDQNNGPCYGGCASDGLTTPKETTVAVDQTIVSQIFSSGLSQTINCQESDTNLDCGAFSITF